MAFSYVQYTGDGSSRDFTFSFTGQDQGYFTSDEILLLVDGVGRGFTLTSSNTLQAQEAPADGATVVIRRVMPKNKTYADFSSGNNFGQDVLNNSFLQLLYVVHELLDGWFPEGFTVREAVDYLEGLRAFKPDPSDPKSVVNFEAGDARYLEIEGDSMQGSLNMDAHPIFVRIAVNGNEPARKDELDRVVSNYQAADANLQSQLTGNVPLEASAFSPISWHEQVVNNSVTIPGNKNAWSFGPVMSIDSGQSVTVREGSFWTIANGEGKSGSEVASFDGNYDYGSIQ